MGPGRHSGYGSSHGQGGYGGQRHYGQPQRGHWSHPSPQGYRYHRGGYGGYGRHGYGYGNRAGYGPRSGNRPGKGGTSSSTGYKGPVINLEFRSHNGDSLKPSMWPLIILHLAWLVPVAVLYALFPYKGVLILSGLVGFLFYICFMWMIYDHYFRRRTLKVNTYGVSVDFGLTSEFQVYWTRMSSYTHSKKADGDEVFFSRRMGGGDVAFGVISPVLFLSFWSQQKLKRMNFMEQDYNEAMKAIREYAKYYGIRESSR